MKNIAAASQHGGVAVADLPLHTDECRIDPGQDRQKPIERDRAIAIVAVVRIAGPGEADPRAMSRTKPRIPTGRPRRRQEQIRRRGWYRRELRPKSPRQ